MAMCRVFGLFLFFMSFSACRSLQTEPQLADLAPEHIKKVEQAYVHMKENNFLKSARIYDELSQLLKGKSVESMMLFNAGSSYRMLKDCQKSISRYRSMIEKSVNQLPLKSRGLLEMSYSYECLGDIKASFLALKDAGDLRVYLPVDHNQIVYPARLSIAYAWFGKKEKAENYKSFALTGVLQSKTRYTSEETMKNVLSELFFTMGRSYTLKDNLKLSFFVPAFSYHQLYLLQSLFLDHSKWSKKAKKELVSLFDRLYLLLYPLKMKERLKYKKELARAFQDGRKVVGAEKSSTWNLFYRKQVKKIKPLLKMK